MRRRRPGPCPGILGSGTHIRAAVVAVTVTRPSRRAKSDCRNFQPMTRGAVQESSGGTGEQAAAGDDEPSGQGVPSARWAITAALAPIGDGGRASQPDPAGQRVQGGRQPEQQGGEPRRSCSAPRRPPAAQCGNTRVGDERARVEGPVVVAQHQLRDPQRLGLRAARRDRRGRFGPRPRLGQPSGDDGRVGRPSTARTAARRCCTRAARWLSRFTSRVFIRPLVVRNVVPLAVRTRRQRGSPRTPTRSPRTSPATPTSPTAAVAIAIVTPGPKAPPSRPAPAPTRRGTPRSC